MATLDSKQAELRQLLQANFAGLTLPDAQLQALAALVAQRALRAGGVLFAQGQPVQAFYAVQRGEIETRLVAADGTVSVLEFVQPLSFFGLSAFATGLPSRYEALAGRAARVWVFGAEAYRLLMDEVPGFARGMLAELARRYDGTLNLLEASRHRGAAERLRLALAQLARERTQGAPDAQGWLTLSATQAEVAALANLSRQTVNTLLREATAAGWLRQRYGRLSVQLQALSAASMSARSFSGASLGA
jgi:CRP-like cAMP-binding protein